MKLSVDSLNKPFFSLETNLGKVIYAKLLCHCNIILLCHVNFPCYETKTCLSNKYPVYYMRPIACYEIWTAYSQHLTVLFEISVLSYILFGRQLSMYNIQMSLLKLNQHFNQTKYVFAMLPCLSHTICLTMVTCLSHVVLHLTCHLTFCLVALPLWWHSTCS